MALGKDQSLGIRGLIVRGDTRVIPEGGLSRKGVDPAGAQEHVTGGMGNFKPRGDGAKMTTPMNKG